MPRLWRRIFLLSRVDGLNASSVSEILLDSSKEDAVEGGSCRPEAFIAAHLEEAGVSKTGTIGSKALDWSALFRPEARQPHCGPRRRTMKNDLHLVCPHCQSINRVPTAKLSEHPNCGRCQQPCSRASPSRVDHGDVLAPTWSAKRSAAAGRFLGAMVRAVQDDGATVPAKRRTSSNRDPAGEGEYQAEPHRPRSSVSRSIPTLALFRGGRRSPVRPA